MEKLIYVHVLTLAEKDNKEDLVEVYKESRNDWYVIKPKTNGDDGVEMCGAFEGVASLNHPNPPVKHTECQVMGSSIYVLGGTCLVCNFDPDRCDCNSSSLIRCIDTQNPKHGWRTCFTIPIPVSLGSPTESAVVDDCWLYVFAANYDYTFDRNIPRCYAFDVVDGATVEAIPHVGGIPYPPCFATCVSPGTLVAYLGGYENKFYQLDCNESGRGWRLFMKGFPYPHFGTYAVEDGMLYILREEESKFISYDIGKKEEVFVASLPQDFPFGVGELVVLSRNTSFCYLTREWPSYPLMHLSYTRFSVHYQPPQSDDPYVLIEENYTFAIEGACALLNLVAVDPQAGAAKSSVDMASGEKAVKLE